MLVCFSKGLNLNCCGIQTGFLDQSCLQKIVQKGKKLSGFISSTGHAHLIQIESRNEWIRPMCPPTCVDIREVCHPLAHAHTIRQKHPDRFPRFPFPLWVCDIESSPRLLLLSQWLPSHNLTCTDARLGELELKIMTLDCRCIVFS